MNKNVDKKLISIIVPVFNTESFFLRKCLESIQKQDYSNFEVLLIDGGSNNECLSLLRDFVKADKRFSLYSSNKGAGLQRNKGIELSNGDFILFIDSDDYISSNFINDIFNYMIANNFDIVAPIMMKEVYENCTVVKSYEMPHEIVEGEINENNYFINSTTSGITHPVKLYRKSIIGETRLPNLDRGEDMLFNYYLSKKRFNYGICKTTTYYYTSKIGANYATKKMDFSTIKIVKIVHSLIRKHKHDNKENLDGLRKTFDFLFGNYFKSSASRFKVLYLIYLIPDKFEYLKRVRGKRKLFVLFPIMYTIAKRLFSRNKKDV